MIRRPALLVGLLAGHLGAAAVAQDALAPCRAVLPEPVGYVEAFRAEGWTLAETEDQRAQALLQLRPAAFFVHTGPRPPDDAEEHARLLERAATSRQDRHFDRALLLTRGEDEAAAILFDASASQSGYVLECWAAAPHLPEIDALSLAPLSFDGIETALLQAESAPTPPEGATSLRLWATRLNSGFAMDEPVPGADVLLLSLEREEGRYTLLDAYGPLRAFGADEMADALRAAED